MSPYTNTFLFEQIIHRFALGQMVIFILLCFEFRYFKYFFSPALKWRRLEKEVLLCLKKLLLNALIIEVLVSLFLNVNLSFQWKLPNY